MQSTNNTTAKSVFTVIAEILLLGIPGFIFNRVCLKAYSSYIGSQAEMPMKIGIVLTYIIGVQVPLTGQLINHLDSIMATVEAALNAA